MKDSDGDALYDRLHKHTVTDQQSTATTRPTRDARPLSELSGDELYDRLHPNGTRGVDLQPGGDAA